MKSYLVQKGPYDASGCNEGLGLVNKNDRQARISGMDFGNS
jgi:hypothetical protein